MTEDPYSDEKFQLLINQIAAAIFTYKAGLEDCTDRRQYLKDFVASVENWVEEAIAFEQKHAEWLINHKPRRGRRYPFSKEREICLVKLFNQLEFTTCGASYKIARAFVEGRATYGSKIAVRTDDEEPDPPKPTASTAGQDDNAWLSVGSLLEKFEVPESKKNLLEKKLERFRGRNFKKWQEVENPLPNKPKYLYCAGAVKDILLDLSKNS